MTTQPISAADHDYAQYRMLRTELADHIAEVASVAHQLGLHARSQHLLDVQQRLLDSRFRLMVLGEFKRGKSTLVNALLGEAVLPMKVAPCTGRITEIRYGDPASAWRWSGAPGESPKPLALSEIRDHITIGSGASAETPPGDGPTPRIELRYPLPLLADGIELVDSPGLNEHAVRTALALEDLPRADAVLLVLSCEQQLGHTERMFLEQHLPVGHDGRLANVFFLWNRFDAIADDPVEVEALTQLSDAVLQPRVSGGARIFCVSARDALVGRVRGEHARIEASRFLAFEAELARFLTVERGRVKLVGPLHAARGAVEDLRATVLPERERLLRAPVEALEARIEDLGPRLAGVRQQRAELVRLLGVRRTALARRLRVLLGMFGRSIHDQLPATIDRVHVQWAGATWNRNAVVTALGEWLQAWLAEEAATFERTHLRPLLEQEAQELDRLLEDRLTDLLAELDALRAGFMPQVEGAAPSLAPELSATERVLSAVGGFVMGGPGGAVEGATFGWRNVVGGLPVYLSVGLVLALTGASLPVALGVVTGLGVFRTWLGGKGAAERLRDEVHAGFSEAFDKELGRMAERVEGEVSNRYQHLIDTVDEATRMVIVELEEELSAVQTRHAEGARVLAEGLAALAANAQTLERLTDALGAISRRIAAP